MRRLHTVLAVLITLLRSTPLCRQRCTDTNVSCYDAIFVCMLQVLKRMQASNRLYPNGDGVTQLGVHRPPSIMSEATLSQWLTCMSRDNVGMLTKVWYTAVCTAVTSSFTYSSMHAVISTAAASADYTYLLSKELLLQAALLLLCIHWYCFWCHKLSLSHDCLFITSLYSRCTHFDSMLMYAVYAPLLYGHCILHLSCAGYKRWWCW
jgi:hypothetical protein